MCRLVCGFVFAFVCAAPVPAAQKPIASQASSIKRFMFSTDSFVEIASEFAKLKGVLADVPREPAAGKTTWTTGTGSSGFPTPYSIDHVRGRFHVYAERWRPQHPFSPYSYVTQEIVFDTPDPQVSPVGKLTYPKSGGSFSAVVLVAGTGAHDRDVGMSLYRTLWVLADHLTRQGFAVLRYDKRGVGLIGGERHA